MYCTVLYWTGRTVLNWTVLCCAVLYVLFCTELLCTVLYCTVLPCTVLYCTVLYYTVLYCTALNCIVYCIALYGTVLYRTALHCTGPGQTRFLSKSYRKRSQGPGLCPIPTWTDICVLRECLPKTGLCSNPTRTCFGLCLTPLRERNPVSVHISHKPFPETGFVFKSCPNHSQDPVQTVPNDCD